MGRRGFLYSVSLEWFRFAVSRLEVEELDFVPLILDDSIDYQSEKESLW